MHHRRAAEDYESPLASNVIPPESVGQLCGIDAGGVKIYELPKLRVIKISFHRPATVGGFEYRHRLAVQQYIPVAKLTIPALPHVDRSAVIRHAAA